MGTTKKKNYDKEMLRRMYVDENKIFQQIADELGCEKKTAILYLHKYDIRTRKIRL